MAVGITSAVRCRAVVPHHAAGHSRDLFFLRLWRLIVLFVVESLSLHVWAVHAAIAMNLEPYRT
jgi:hypothetical protein